MNVTGEISGISDATVSSGATLTAGGNITFTGGDDSFTVAGTVDGASTINLGAGNDTFTFQDGASVSAVVDGDAGDDTLTADIANAATLAQVNNFETLTKRGAGTLNVTGDSDFSTVEVDAGVLNITGGLIDVDLAEVSSGATLDVGGGITFADNANTTLTVAGTLNNGAGSQTALTGSSGANTVNVTGTLFATGDLGDGADTLDVSGTLDTGAGELTLGLGDDIFSITDGTIVRGTVDGGAGADTFNTNINGVATVGAVKGFETLTKTGAGTLNVTGPDASDFATVNVNAGTLDVASGGAISGVNTASVGTGAAIDLDGGFTFTTGNDSFDVAGTLTGSGTFNLDAGNDTLTLRDGADLSGLTTAIDGGADTDTVVVDAAGDLTLDGSNLTDFEELQKNNTGELTLTGNQGYSAGITLNGGELTVAGTLNNGAGSQTALTGSSGANTVNVTGTLFATGDLGDGADTLNVSGILDTGADDLTLGLGDDTFSITDGTVVRGTVDGGAGADTFNTNINGVATVGAVKGFETLTKAGIGTLNVTGPDASDFATVNVNAGTLDVASGGAISGVNTASVGTDAEIDLDGGFSFTTGDDSFDVAGTLTGSGTFNLDAGNDTLTLRDGADLSGLTTAIDGGADTDTVVVDAAGDLTLDDSNLTDFEALQKDNTGELTLTGNQGYSEGIALNGGELTVAGTLGTAEVSAEDGTTLTVEGTLNNGAGSQTEFTDFNGANTVNVTGTLFATGDLGDGADTLDVSGTLDTGAGELTLGLGDDTFSITDGTVVRGTVDGGVGADTFNTNINGVATVGAVEGFETLTKTGTGTLNVAGASDFSTVNVNAGLLNATGGLSGINAATVLSGATLTAGGNITFTGGDDSFTVAGTVDGASTINLGGGNDTFTFQDGASVSAVVDGDAGDDTLTADIANAATLAQVNNFETLTKRGAGTLSVTGTSDFATVEVDEGTLDVETGGAISGVNAASVGTGATIDLDDGFTFTTGNDGFDVAGRLTGSGTFDLDTGNDTLTLRDGADLSGLTTAIDGGADTDTVIVDATGDLTLDESNLTNFEALQKNNSGELTLTGDQEYSEGIALNGGELTVDTGGNVSTSGVALADSTILRVRGILQNGTTTLTGSPGSNTVIVDATGTLMAMGDLGAGTDLLDVAGSLDTGLGSLSLGLDDDTFTIYDSTMLTGLIDGGEGVDTVNANIDIASDVNTTANFEVLNKNGAGVLNLSGSATTGFTTVNVNNGILNSSNAFEIGGDLNVLAEGTFRNQALGATTLSILGDIRNAGAIDLQDGAAGDRIVVSGDYTGGGTLLLDVNLADGTADTLDITGAVSSGTTTIFVNDLTPGTANTSDIVIVDVAGTTSAGDFQLAGGELVSGAFTYVLNLIGSQWVLQLEILPQNFLYEAYPRNLQALNQLSSHRERGQNRSWLFKDELDSRPTGVWMRIGGSVNDLSPSFSTFEQNSGAEIDYDINTAKYEVGLDTRLADSAAGQLVGGAWLFYGNSSLSGASALANGDIDTDAFGVGASLTWYSNSKFYADAQFQYAAFDSDLSTEADTLTSNNKGSGRAWSLEVGRPFSLNNSVSITPELQYVYSDVDFDTFTTDSGETVSLQDGSSSEVKLGATFEYNSGLGQTQSNQTVNRFFVSTNVYHQFDTTTEVDSTGTSLVNEVRPWRGELGIGGSREWIGKNGARSALFGELSVGSEFGSSFSSGRSLSGNLGFRVEF
ncbi:hypothetical protein RA27_21920 [Ruegeria sp. ANG-R]|uniref:beta strand repeat-containing protein n=1 Tax=Ruegeria sp. ANG-R TaxID=1577903 RepID=UPI00057C4799|nr:autotransporter outer membrane beta-barrel domain-containing protein [Ruegeria sp. ANG-R]KIC36668.1 hypothetical protein RA27_21920 [Ruegeria sp. ANG-R]